MRLFTAQQRAVILGALVVGLAAAPPPSPARMPVDLDLKETGDMVVVTPQPNPHERLDCPACHGNEVPRGRPVRSSPVEEFLSDSYPDSICYECHETWAELHPTRIDPNKSRLNIVIPSNVLPLRFIHEGWYSVVCMTCHDIHFPHDGYKLLRGYSLNPLDRQPLRFPDRMAMCEACHGDQMEYLTPHKVRSQQGGCTLCHVRKPSGGRTQPLRANVNVLCTYCHPVFPEPHYLHFNPFPDLEQETIWESGIPLRDGAYTCVTCHQPHGTTAYPAYLREEFVNLTRISVRINPHEKGLFCQNCHSDPMLSRANQKRSTALLEKDVNALCSRCHAVGKIGTMEHYLGPVTDRVKKPKDLPLKDGKITCITCHLPGCGPVDPGNPMFVRSDPDSVRTFCGRCHEWRQLAARDSHAEYAGGRGCEVCHEKELPAEDDPLGKPGPIRADQNFVCYQCHEADPHPASHRHTVKPVRADFLKVDSVIYPLDRYQRITCYSCHQIMKKTQGNNFLPVEGSGCQHCHPY